MKIQDTDIYRLKYFTYGKAFTGSAEKMRYRIIREKDGDEEKLQAAVYPQPYCWEETAEEKKQIREFEFSEKGRTAMIEWLNQKLEEFI